MTINEFAMPVLTRHSYRSEPKMSSMVQMIFSIQLELAKESEATIDTNSIRRIMMKSRLKKKK